MRNIETKEEKEKKGKKIKVYTIIALAILVMSIAAYAFLSVEKQEEKTYNKQKFLLTERGWQTTIKGITLITIFFPSELENITVKGFFSIEDFKNKIYYVFTPKETAAVTELDMLLGRAANSRQSACLREYENESFCAELPIKSCEDASSEQAIIIFKEVKRAGEENETFISSISYNNYCLEIEAREEETLKAADKIIFILLGIMER